jgi:membrane associated rhomboid family serine protease
MLSITTLLIGVSIVMSLLAFNKDSLKFKLLLNPYRVIQGKEYYRVLTHAFIHGDYMHLFVNMYVFWGFGTSVEQIFTNQSLFESNFQSFEFWGETQGIIYFLLLYFGGVLFAAIPALRKHKDNPDYNSLGASGAVSSVLLAYILMFPQNKLMFIFLPIPIPAYVMGIIFFVYESFMNRRGGTGIAHDAHLWGALFGLGFMMLLSPEFLSHFIHGALGN